MLFRVGLFDRGISKFAAHSGLSISSMLPQVTRLNHSHTAKAKYGPCPFFLKNKTRVWDGCSKIRVTIADMDFVERLEDSRPGSSTSISITLPKSLVERVDEARAPFGITRTVFIKAAVEQGLESLSGSGQGFMVKAESGAEPNREPEATGIPSKPKPVKTDAKGELGTTADADTTVKADAKTDGESETKNPETAVVESDTGDPVPDSDDDLDNYFLDGDDDYFFSDGSDDDEVVYTVDDGEAGDLF